MYRKKYGLLSTDNQGKPVGGSNKGPSGSHKNHSALSGEQYIDIQGVAGSGLRRGKLGLFLKKKPN
jgi:hypothetical protein